MLHIVFSFFKITIGLHLAILLIFYSELQSARRENDPKGWTPSWKCPAALLIKVTHTVPSAAWPPLSLSQAKENRWLQCSASFKTKQSICGDWSYLFACDEQGRGRVKSASKFSSNFHPAVWFFSSVVLLTFRQLRCPDIMAHKKDHGIPVSAESRSRGVSKPTCACKIIHVCAEKYPQFFWSTCKMEFTSRMSMSYFASSLN